MTVVNPKSISGITSITTPSGSDDLLTIHNNNGTERFRLQSDKAMFSVDIKVDSNNARDLGASGAKFKDAYITNLRADVGVVTAFSGDISIDDKIVHVGDTNTSIRFPTADTVSVETGGSERSRIDSSGRLLVGHTASETTYYTGRIQVQGVNSSQSCISIKSNQNDSGGPALVLAKSRGSLGGTTVVQNNDQLGSIYFNGADGTDATSYGAEIRATVDGSPGSNDMPGRLSFYTTADGAATGTERLRINSVGKVGINSTAPDGMLAIEHTSSAPNLTMRNHPAAGPYSNNYGMELRHAYGSVQHGALIHTQEAADTRRSLDVSDSSGVFATFVNGKVGIKTDIPVKQLNVTGEARIQASGDSSSYVNIKNNQIYMDANGTGYLDVAHIGGDLQVRTSTSSALDTTGPTFKSNGNLAFADGKGIDFGASSGGNSTSEVLDDYEEGTWSAAVTYSSSNSGLNVTEGNGKYIRVGHLVHCTCLLSWDEGSASGDVVMTGLPFTIRNDSHVRLGGHAIYLDGFSNLSGSNIFLYNTGNMTTANMYRVSGDNDSHLGPSDSTVDSADTSNSNTTRFMLHYYCQ